MLKELEVGQNKIINIFVGPEGGFSDDEVWKFERNNFDRAFFWDNIIKNRTCLN